MENQKKQIREYIIQQLRDGVGEGCEAPDLHHELLNTSLFIEGSTACREFCGSDVFDIIQVIKEYENDNFGEVTTDLSNPERVANMFAYIEGDNILMESQHIYEVWELNEVTAEDLTKIADELGSAKKGE